MSEVCHRGMAQGGVPEKYVVAVYLSVRIVVVVVRLSVGFISAWSISAWSSASR